MSILSLSLVRKIELFISVTALLTLGAPGVQAQGAPHGRIVWDTYGVPHVFAKNTEGLFYGFGYAQLQAHGNLILHLYAQARGREAEYFGAKFEETDKYNLANGVWERGQAWYGQQTPEMKRYLQAFAAGMNAYAKEHPEGLAAEVKVVLPVTAEDVVAHWERVMEFQYLAPITKVFPAPQAEAMLHEPLPRDDVAHDDAGSNGWALAPKKSADGHAMLLMNPHLAWAPSFMTYFEAQLSAPGIEMYGATQVGFPVLRFCFSPDHGITNTVNTISAATVYKLTLEGDGYRYDGKVMPFERSEKTLQVKQADGSLKNESVTLRSSVQGPVFTRSDGVTVAVRVPGLDRPFGIQEYWDIDKAVGFAAVESALKRLQVPMFNIIYADKDGHILYQFNGMVPVRSHGDFAYWNGLVPGDTSENLWTKIHPYEDLPRVLDPPAGWVDNTNNPPWISTALPPLDPAKYPPYMSPNSLGLRAQQSEALLSSQPKFTFDELVQKKLSTHVLLTDRVLDDLLAAAKDDPRPLVQQAVKVLTAWDRADNNDSRGALLFETWAGHFAGPQFLGQGSYAKPWTFSDPIRTPMGIKSAAGAVDMLETAAKETAAKYGSIDRPFGDVSRYHIGDVNVPGNGGFGNTGVFRVITWSPMKNGERTPIHGETFICMVEFGKTIKAMGLVTYGESSQPGSKHNGDELGLLSEKKLRPVWLTAAELTGHTEQEKSF